MDDVSVAVLGSVPDGGVVVGGWVGATIVEQKLDNRKQNNPRCMWLHCGTWRRRRRGTVLLCGCVCMCDTVRATARLCGWPMERRSRQIVIDLDVVGVGVVLFR